MRAHGNSASTTAANPRTAWLRAQVAPAPGRAQEGRGATARAEHGRRAK